MANNFGKGIKITSGFDLSAKGPIDNRTVVDTLAQRDAHISAGRVYEGLKVFVTATQKEYVYTKTGWAESGGITDDQLSQLTAAYAHSMSEHVSNETVDGIIEQIKDLPTLSEVNEMIETKADVAHNHNDFYYNKEEVDKKIVDAVTDGQVDLSNYATLGHLAAKADLGHSHTMSDMPGLSDELNKKADKDSVATIEALATKADTNHEHDISTIKNLQDTLDLKANIANVYNKTELNSKFTEFSESINAKAEVGHRHNDLYYGKAEVDEAIAKAMTDGKIDLSGYATLEDLAGKENVGHNHNDIYARIEHNHNDAYYKKTEVDNFLANKSDSNHHHNDVYYTQAQMDIKLAEVVTNGQLSLDGYATKTELTEGLASKAALSHTHTPSDLQGIEDILPDTYNKQEIDTAIVTAKTEAMTQANNLFAGLLDEVSDEFNTLSKIEDNFLELKADMESEVNGLENSLSGKSDTNHNHDERYYDKATVESMIETGISGANLEQYATKSNLAEGLAGKSDLGHGHTISNIENLNDLLGAKMNASEGATTKALEEGLAAKSDVGHNHNDVYYTQDEVDERIKSGISGVDLSQLATKSELSQGLGTKSDLGHGHDISQVSNLQTALDSKANKDDLEDSTTEVKDYVDQKVAQVEAGAKVYTDTAVTNLVDSAPEAMNTLNELANAIKENKDVYDAYVDTIAQQLESKADANHNHNGVYANAEHKHELEDFTGLFDNVYTEEEVDGFLASKSDVDHNHNGIYYTKDEVDERVQSGVDSVDLSQLATKSELNQGLATKAELNHGHALAHIDGLQDELDKKMNTDIAATKEELRQGLDSKADFNHEHDDDYAAKIHNHDDLYFTKEYMEEMLKDSSDDAVLDAVIKANLYTDEEILKVIGGENEKDITTITGVVNELINHEKDFDTYKEDTNDLLSEKAPIQHKHDITDINSLNETLEDININIDKKVNADDVYTKAEINSALDEKAEVGHKHDDVYSQLEHTHMANEITDLYNDIYKKSEIETALDAKADTEHGHDISQISNLQETLDSKMNKADSIEQNNELKEYVDKQINQAKTEAQNYTDGEVLELVDNAPDDMNTLNKLASAIVNNKTSYDQYMDNIAQQLETKAEIGHDHDGVYANFSHAHELTDLNGLESRLGKVQGDAISQAVADSNNYTDNQISKIIGVDGDGDTIFGLSSKLEEHIQNFETYQGNMNTALGQKADVNHGHELAHVSGLQDALDLKANKSELDTVGTNMQAAIDEARILAETNAKNYTDKEVNALVDSAPETMNTLNELATAIKDNKDIYDAYVNTMSTALAGKADVEHVHSDYVTKDEMMEEIEDIDLSDYALKTELSNYSKTNHVHDDRYYLKYQVDVKIANLGIDGYATLQDLQTWAELFALREHTHDNLNVSINIDDAELDEMLTDIFGNELI